MTKRDYIIGIFDCTFGALFTAVGFILLVCVLTHIPSLSVGEFFGYLFAAFATGYSGIRIAELPIKNGLG